MPTRRTSLGTIGKRYQYVGKEGYETFDGVGLAGPGGGSGVGGFVPFLHLGARWYDPSTGRFLQRDPIGITGGLNVYVYVGSNPLISRDPSGNDIESAFAGMAGVADGDEFLDVYGPWGEDGLPLGPPTRPLPDIDQIIIDGTDWIEHPMTLEVQYWADWASWGCAIPIAKMPKAFSWAKWGWTGITKVFGL